MISLFVQNGVAYVWNAEDWHTLRTNHHICGSLIGSAPSFPRQNDFLGLPMALMLEEAALLTEKGVCELYELPKLLESASERQKDELKRLQERILEDQSEALKKRKIEQLSQKIDIIMAGKRQKLLSQGVTDVNLDKQTLLQEEINKLKNVAPEHILVHLPTEHYIATDRKKEDIDVLKPSLRDRKYAVHYAVYKDLWEKGYYITSGSKFGCDFLVYPGDPVKFHAMSMVRCIEDQTKSLQPSRLVAFGRLSVSVNKLAVLAYRTTQQNIEYQTVQWHET